MTEPFRLGSEASLNKLQEILEARGITPDTIEGEVEDDGPRPDEPGHPAYHHQQRLTVAVGRWITATPRRYQQAQATHPDVIAWAKDTAADPDTATSLLLSGPTGTGKTHEAYGALRAIADTGPDRYEVIATTAADMYGSLRPAAGVGVTEHRLTQLCEIQYLLLDDLGSAKASEWTEEITYRVINTRYNACLPTIFTSNLPPRAPLDENGRPQGPDLTGALGDRIVSRLAEMTTLVAIKGGDRRRQQAGVA